MSSLAVLNGQNVGTNKGINGLARQLGLDYGGGDVMGQIMPFLSTALYPGAIQQAAYASNLVPQQEQNLSNMIRSASQGNMWGNAGAIRAGDMAQAGDAAAQLGAQLRSAPAGIGTNQAAMVQSTNGANQAANNYLGNVNSPQGLSQMQQTLGQLYGQGLNPSLLNSLMSMAGPMNQVWGTNNQQQQQNFQDSIGGQLGGIAAGASGSLGKYLTGGMGGSGGGAVPGYTQSMGGWGNGGYNGPYASGQVQSAAKPPSMSSSPGAGSSGTMKPPGYMPSFNGGVHIHMSSPAGFGMGQSGMGGGTQNGFNGSLGQSFASFGGNGGGAGSQSNPGMTGIGSLAGGNLGTGGQ